MGMAVKVKMLLAVRGMTLKELGAKLEPPTSVQNISKKIKRDNLTERDLTAIAKACNATFKGGFVLNDTGTEIQ
ncbi:MAG: transcriptional regulator [Oscillospiraceae bacterium]|jgi:hypothetical protein|nr:transcriptional regulator [Oscillospiraceae bacterium]